MSGRVSDKQFAKSRHRYTDPRTGERVTGVTSIVGCFDSGDKLGAGAGAAVRLTKAGMDYRREWNEKRDLGTRVHGYASLWAAGRAAEVVEGDEAYMDAFEGFIKHYQPTFLEFDRAVVHRAGFGGEFDLVAELNDGNYWLLDLKTGKQYLPELTLQLSGYRYADGMIVYDSEGNAHHLDPMPHIDKCGGVYLDEKGRAELVECPVDEGSFKAFVDLLGVKNWAAAVTK